MREKLYDADFVRALHRPAAARAHWTPSSCCAAEDVFGGPPGEAREPDHGAGKPGEALPAAGLAARQIIPEELRDEWGDYVWWDREGERAAARHPRPGRRALAGSSDPLLEGAFEVTLADGTKVTLRPVFDLVKEYAGALRPEDDRGDHLGAGGRDRRARPRRSPQTRARRCSPSGMGPNQFFNNDIKDRAIFLVAALTGNVGHIGGNVGSLRRQLPRRALQRRRRSTSTRTRSTSSSTRPKPARVEAVLEGRVGPLLQPRGPPAAGRQEDAHRQDPHADARPSRCGSPTPTRSSATSSGTTTWSSTCCRKIEMIAVNEWWWSTSCEYADVVFAVDSWAELKHPDMTASVTNPFLQVFPRTPLPRIFDTRGDIECLALVAKAWRRADRRPALRELLEVRRRGPHRRLPPAHPRRLDATRGYRFEDLRRRRRRASRRS